jgi:hypothetical protein
VSPAADTDLLHLAPESIEALAVRLAELLGDPPPPSSSEVEEGGMISAARVAELWDVQRRWVYEHRDDLGVARLGKGPRPRLRFDPDVVAERLGAPRPERHGARPDRRRSTWTRAPRRSDSLSTRTRANVVEDPINTSGRALERPPDMAPNRRRGN